MNAEQQQKFLEHLKREAVKHPSLNKLGERVASMKKDELLQLDEATLYTILDVTFEVVIQSKPRGRFRNANVPSESVDPDELLDDTSWGVL